MTMNNTQKRLRPYWLTEDVERDWLNVLRRLQSVAKTEGFAVITISVLVDRDGRPKAWSEPRLSKIEPSRRADEIIYLLGLK